MVRIDDDVQERVLLERNIDGSTTRSVEYKEQEVDTLDSSQVRRNRLPPERRRIGSAAYTEHTSALIVA